MLVIPAIDLKDHQVVRLKQGRMNAATVYSSSLLPFAQKWIEQGAMRLHCVDLNGAFEGTPVHFDDVARVAKKFPDVQIEVGGGIRTIETIKNYFSSGVSYVILGTAAVKNPKLVAEACELFPGKIILGVDARDGLVAVDGWDQVSRETALDLVKRFSGLAIESVIYTDIAKDGMLAGMNLEKIAAMKACGFPVIASGGLTSLKDIEALCDIGGLHGVIAGKAVYENLFSVKEAIEVVRKRAAC